MSKSDLNWNEEPVEAVLGPVPSGIIRVSSLVYLLVFAGLLFLLFGIKIPESLSTAASCTFFENYFVVEISNPSKNVFNPVTGQFITCEKTKGNTTKEEISGMVSASNITKQGNVVFTCTYALPAKAYLLQLKERKEMMCRVTTTEDGKPLIRKIFEKKQQD